MHDVRLIVANAGLYNGTTNQIYLLATKYACSMQRYLGAEIGHITGFALKSLLRWSHSPRTWIFSSLSLRRPTRIGTLRMSCKTTLC